MCYCPLKDADSDGNGTLDSSEFRAMIQSFDLDLSQQEINALMSEIDVDGNEVESKPDDCPCQSTTHPPSLPMSGIHISHLFIRLHEHSRSCQLCDPYL